MTSESWPPARKPPEMKISLSLRGTISGTDLVIVGRLFRSVKMDHDAPSGKISTSIEDSVAKEASRPPKIYRFFPRMQMLWLNLAWLTFGALSSHVLDFNAYRSVLLKNWLRWVPHVTYRASFLKQETENRPYRCLAVSTKFSKMISSVKLDRPGLASPYAASCCLEMASVVLGFRPEYLVMPSVFWLTA